MLKDFEQLGFGPVVRMLASGDRLSPDNHKWQDNGGWIYAFVADGEVMYVGKCTTVLRNRLDAYRFGPDHGKRIREFAIEQISNGKEVWLYGLPTDDYEFMDREERRLIREYRPPWNRQIL